MKSFLTYLKKSRSKQAKGNTEFKSFFRVSLQDRPVSLLSKSYEIYKVNPTVNKMTLALKWCFALTFLLYFK